MHRQFEPSFYNSPLLRPSGWSSSSCMRRAILAKAFLWRRRFLHLRVAARASDAAICLAEAQRLYTAERRVLQHHVSFFKLLHQPAVLIPAPPGPVRRGSMPKGRLEPSRTTCPFGQGSDRLARSRQHHDEGAPAAPQSKLQRHSRAAKGLATCQQRTSDEDRLLVMCTLSAAGDMCLYVCGCGCGCGCVCVWCWMPSLRGQSCHELKSCRYPHEGVPKWL